MLWIIIAFISPILYGFSNVLDNYLTNKLFKNIWTLTFYSTMFGTAFLPLIFFFELPNVPPTQLWPWLIAIGAIEILYLYPYFKALQSDDTSIVSSLFSLGRIFVPIFAFLFVDEVLTLTQYLGFLVIILSSAVLTLNTKGKLRLNKSFFYMLACSSLLALEAVIYKYIFDSASWSTGFTWTRLVTFIIALGFLLVPHLRRDIRVQLSHFKTVGLVFTLEELITFVGSIAATYAITLVPVTLAKGVDAFQPIFVLLYAIILSKAFPQIFREQIDRRTLLKKSILFVLMIIGILLIVL